MQIKRQFFFVSSILTLLVFCSQPSNRIPLAEFEYFLTQKLGGEYKNSHIYIVANVYGCRGCLDLVFAEINKLKNKENISVICVADNKVEYLTLMDALPGIEHFQDQHGEIYDFFHEIRSAHFLITINKNEINYFPITPQNLELVNLKLQKN